MNNFLHFQVPFPVICFPQKISRMADLLDLVSTPPNWRSWGRKESFSPFFQQLPFCILLKPAWVSYELSQSDLCCCAPKAYVIRKLFRFPGTEGFTMDPRASNWSKSIIWTVPRYHRVKYSSTWFFSREGEWSRKIFLYLILFFARENDPKNVAIFRKPCSSSPTQSNLSPPRKYARSSASPKRASRPEGTQAPASGGGNKLTSPAIWPAAMQIEGSVRCWVQGNGKTSFELCVIWRQSRLFPSFTPPFLTFVKLVVH